MEYIFFTNDQEYVLIFVIKIRFFFLIHDSLSICSQSNTAGATSRAAPELMPGLFFALV